MAKQPKPPKGVKPGKNYYWNGQEWVFIQQRTPAKPPAKPAPPKPLPPARKTLTVEQQAQSIVDAQLAAIEEQQAAWRQGLQDEAKRRAEQAQAFARMVQGMGIDKNIQGIYSNAGQDVAGYGAGFSGGFRQQADASAAETINMLGGDASQVRNEGDGIANVMYGMGGYIPSASLAAQGAAFAADAANQPGFMLQQGLMEAQRGLEEGLSQNPFLDAILKTKLSKQDLVKSLREERTEMNFQQMELKLKQIENDRDYWLKIQGMYLAKDKYKLAAQAEKRAREAERRYAMETAGRDAYGEVSPDYYEDKQGRIVPKGYKYNSKGILVKAATAGSSKDKDAKEGGLTVNAQAEMLERVYKAEDDIGDLALKLAKEYNWRPTAGQATSRAVRNRIAAEIRRRYGWVTTTKAKKALAEIIGRALTKLATMGPPATGAAGTGGAADPFWDTL